MNNGINSLSLSFFLCCSTKCAILNFEAKKQIVIDEIFDSMIVFSKANWIRWGPTGVDTSSDGKLCGVVWCDVREEERSERTKTDGDVKRDWLISPHFTSLH